MTRQPSEVNHRTRLVISGRSAVETRPFISPLTLRRFDGGLLKEPLKRRDQKRGLHLFADVPARFSDEAKGIAISFGD